mmetsp:Transcript_11041/g.24342  ORF Transcript_11041/g.24342 Transcript_11041/m.24342 type:complete len:294 (+) Transcript_11041:139-1020(+)
MKKDASPAAAKCTPASEKCHDVADDVMCADDVATQCNTTPPRATVFPSSTTTPKKKNADEYLVATPPKSVGSCKRRRLASEDDENIGDQTPANSRINSPRKINYEKNDSDTSDDEDDELDPFKQEMVQMRQESILKKMKRLNYEDDEDQLLHTAAFAKLFEYVKDYDVVATNSSAATARSEEDTNGSNSKAAVEGAWIYRGSGHVKFIKCLEEGYNCGMIRMELTKNGTIETLMCHELTHEEVVPMPSKKRKQGVHVEMQGLGLPKCNPDLCNPFLRRHGRTQMENTARAKQD